MNEKAEQLKARAAAFARAVIALCDSVPATTAGQTITRQLIAAATSVAANYRATCRARSKAEFIAKIGTVEEEADECAGWLRMLVDTKLLAEAATESLIQEADELTAIFAASARTAKCRMNKSRNTTLKKPPPQRSL